MSDNDPPFDDLSEEDQEIWDSYTADITLSQNEETGHNENFKELLDTCDVVDHQSRLLEESKTPQSIEEKIQHKDQLSKIGQHAPQLDRRTEEKLRKGKVPIEARFDLHGMTREIAHEALEKFIIQSSQSGLRHVLVITGKGKSKSTSDEWLSVGRGVLKENVPYWLEGIVLRPYILKYMHAQPKDGGNGALYVYLKRQR
jgi:DNA-nicking Smr family endonuclease